MNKRTACIVVGDKRKVSRRFYWRGFNPHRLTRAEEERGKCLSYGAPFFYVYGCIICLGHPCTMNVIKEIQRINEVELKRGIPEHQSWHADYKDSAWVFIGGLPLNLTEGDVLCVFSQWGEIEDLHLVRDEQTGKAKGFAFLKYEDQRSTNLVVDNANGAIILGRTIRVDHKKSYEAPKKVGAMGKQGSTRFRPLGNHSNTRSYPPPSRKRKK